MVMEREQKLRREAAVIGNTREILPSVTQVLSILLTTSAISASVERANFKGCVA